MAETPPNPPLEHHIIHAALLTTRPTSTPKERSDASYSLEQWTSTSDPAVWQAYINILKSFSVNPTASSSGEWGSDRSNSSSFEYNIVEKIAYATSSLKQQAMTASFENQIRHEAIGAKLLILTLLSNKIRREYLRLIKQHPLMSRGLYEELISTLVGCSREDQHVDRMLLSALSTALAAVAVRSSSDPQFPNEGVMEIIRMCRSSIASGIGIAANNQNRTVAFSPMVSLKILSDIPGEVQSRTDLTCAEIESFLILPSHSMNPTSAALETLQLALNVSIGCGEKHDSLFCLTLTALTKWTEESKSVTLSRIHDNGSATNSVLSQLVALLSSQLQQKQWSGANYAQEAITQSARALTACVANTSDYGTESRRMAVTFLLASIQTTQFLTGALKISQSQQWEDAIISISTLSSTLAREEMEEIAQCQLPGCSELFELLLELQSHEVHNAAVPVFEVWLALQDVPISGRHPNLIQPLFRRLVEVILNRVAYPPTFVSWDEELEVESADFEEMRRLSADVLIVAYELLRSYYLETLSNVIISTTEKSNATNIHAGWEIVESALFCLCAVAREACARVKSAQNTLRSGRDSPASLDGGVTATGLTNMVASLCEGGPASAANQHPLVLCGIANFLGSYSVVWSTTCEAPSILAMVNYLTFAMSKPCVEEAAGRGVRLVLIVAASKLGKATSSPGADPLFYHQIRSVLVQCMDAALSGGNPKVMAGVAEGCSRLTVQLGDQSQSRAILSAIAETTIQRSRVELDSMVAVSTVEGSGLAASQSDAASKVLAACLGVLREFIRFSDVVSPKEGEPHVLSDVLNSAWPVLSDIASQACCRSNEVVLAGLLEVHSQLLIVVPTLIGRYFKDLVSFVVRAYEETFCPSALDYVSVAVESFGSEQSDIAVAAGFDDHAKDFMFNQLLAHLCQCTFIYVTQTKRPNECPQVVSALFNMAQRYLLFCPGALCQCPEFASLFSFGVACLTECQGEIESTRSSLIYLYQLISWKHIRLTGPKLAMLEQSASSIDNLLIQHGENMIKSCFMGMLGPQILWPSFSDCLLSVMLHVTEGSPVTGESSLLHSWLYAAMNDDSIVGNSQSLTPDIAMTVAKLLCDLAKEGARSRPKAKMLLMDFAKICRGETGTDSLLAYSLA
ncbi:hypothetical protein ACHAWX_006439 [Stephanocyclus meneghinianus]